MKDKNIIFKSSHLEMFGTQDVQVLLSLPFPIQIGYELTRIMDKIEEEANRYFKSKQKLIDTYSDEEETKKLGPNRFAIKTDKQQEFLDENEKLGSVEIKWSDNKIKIQLNDKELPKLSTTQWKFLMPFITVIK